MGALVGVWRLLLAALAVAFGVLACGFSGVLGRARFAKLAMRWHHLTARALGVHSRCRGAALADGVLLLSNHISWSDILVLGARWPVTFLGNSEIARWPVLGWVISRAGTLFIERGKGADKAVREIGAALGQRSTIVLFPEGTTTDGRSVIRFQPRLIQAAIDAGAPVQPVALRYFDHAGARVVRHSFAGNIALMHSVWKTVSGPAIIAEITLFEPLPPEAGRQELANRAESLVRELVESGESGESSI